MHNSRSASFDRILRRPGRGGLTAKGAEQLQKLFANKVPKTDKPKMGEMDSSAVMVLLQLAADEVEAGELTYESLRQVAEENLIGNGAEAREGAEEDAKAEEDRGMEEAMEVEESKWSLEEEEDKVEDEDWEQGGVVLANDL